MEFTLQLFIEIGTNKQLEKSVSLESEDRREGVDDLTVRERCLEGVEVSSVKTEVCDCTQGDANK